MFAVLLMSPVDNEDIEGALLGRIAVQIDPDDPEAQGTCIRPGLDYGRIPGPPAPFRSSCPSP